jgi:hypothetical protein
MVLKFRLTTNPSNIDMIKAEFVKFLEGKLYTIMVKRLGMTIDLTKETNKDLILQFTYRKENFVTDEMLEKKIRKFFLEKHPTVKVVKF